MAGSRVCPNNACYRLSIASQLSGPEWKHNRDVQRYTRFGSGAHRSNHDLEVWVPSLLCCCFGPSSISQSVIQARQVVPPGLHVACPRCQGVDPGCWEGSSSRHPNSVLRHHSSPLFEYRDRLLGRRLDRDAALYFREQSISSLSAAAGRPRMSRHDPGTAGAELRRLDEGSNRRLSGCEPPPLSTEPYDLVPQHNTAHWLATGLVKLSVPSSWCLAAGEPLGAALELHGRAF